MASTHDIYNPPPAPVPLSPPKPEAIQRTGGDWLALFTLACPLYLAAAWAWSIEPTLGLWVTISGMFMILESWFSAITFLHRHPAARNLEPGQRWMIFFAAILPWLITLALGVVLILGLFFVADATRSQHS